MSDHLRGLNPQQEEAVRTINGPLLVLAGAGTGKTRVVTSRIAEIMDRGIASAAICAVTFTNKAAREMRERVKKVIGKRAEDGLVVSTFHSLGARILRDHGAAIGIPRAFTIADSADQVDIMAEALREGGVGRDVMQPKDAHGRISLWKNDAVLPEAALGRARSNAEESLARAYERYEAALKFRGLVDFDDLILKTLLLLEDHPSVAAQLQARWSHLLVDEYQDTNGSQYRLLRLLAGAKPNVCVVGDDDQSIYGWRGADSARILRFHHDFVGAKVVTLEQNYRSTMTILRAANRVIGNNGERRSKKLWSALGEGDPIQLYVATDEKDEMDHVGRSIERLLANGTKHADVTVLFRTNRQCRPIESALRARRIPYRVVGTFSFFDRREVRDLLAFCRLAQNPNDDSAFLRIANTPPRGLGRGTLDQLKKAAGARRLGLLPAAVAAAAEFPTRAQEGFTTLKTALDALTAEAKATGTGAALSQLADRIQYRDFLKMDVADPLELQMRNNTVDELIATANEFAARGGGGFDAFLESLSLREERDEKKDDGPSVALYTVHAAKGLEFPEVFLVGVEEGFMPHQNSVGDEDDETVVPPQAMEEERRLFYVALTRAKRRLTMSYAVKRTKFGREEPRRPSRFLDEMGREGVEVFDATSNEPASADFAKQVMADFLRKTGRAEQRS